MMENKDFRISKITVWVLVGANLLVTVVGSLARIYHYSYPDFILTLGLILFTSTWIITISDMSRNNIYHKRFWVVLMFLLPSITPIFYLFQREKLIRLANTKFTGYFRS